MKFLVGLIFCFGLQFAISIPVGDALSENSRLSQLTKPFEEPTSVSNKGTNSRRNSFANKVSKRPYFFLSDRAGKVIIIDAISYDEITSYTLPELVETMSVIVGDTFYNIVTHNGTILSTDLDGIMEGPNSISWNLVGSFPKESQYWAGYGAAVDGSLIHFVNWDGNLFLFDTVLRTVTKLGILPLGGIVYASLVIVDKILYIHRHYYLYSYDGTSLTAVTTPEVRHHSAIFKMANRVCRVGGNETDVDPDPVMCYNPKDKIWSTTSYLNEARRYPGIVGMESKTYVFGGLFHFQPPNNVSDFWRSSIEVLNHETNIWSYIPTRLNQGQQYIQALSFYF